MNWPNKTESGASGFVTIGAEQASPPTAVDLLSLRATGRDSDVLVSWTTAQEVDNFGFHVYRSESVGGPYARITDRLIPGLTFSVRGRDYSYVDQGVTGGGSITTSWRTLILTGAGPCTVLCVWTGTGTGSRTTGRSSGD